MGVAGTIFVVAVYCKFVRLLRQYVPDIIVFAGVAFRADTGQHFLLYTEPVLGNT